MYSLLEDEPPNPNGIELAPDATSLDFLQACYRNPSLPLSTRMRAATAALPHEHPKLSATAIVQDQDFAALLDARLRRADKLNGEGTKLIEEKVEPEPEIKQGQPCGRSFRDAPPATRP